MTDDNSFEIDSLSFICMRRASIIFPAETISRILPPQIGSRVLTFRSDIDSLRDVILTRLPVQDIPEKCFVAEKSGHLDFRRSILSMEKYLFVSYFPPHLCFLDIFPHWTSLIVVRGTH